MAGYIDPTTGVEVDFGGGATAPPLDTSIPMVDNGGGTRLYSGQPPGLSLLDSPAYRSGKMATSMSLSAGGGMSASMTTGADGSSSSSDGSGSYSASDAAGALGDNFLGRSISVRAAIRLIREVGVDLFIGMGVPADMLASILAAAPTRRSRGITARQIQNARTTMRKMASFDRQLRGYARRIVGPVHHFGGGKKKK